jgi:putative transposase
MPRQARIDAPGALQHIICRGIERRNIFRDDADREYFIDRLGDVLLETSTPCYAWSLMPNHFHLLLRTGNIAIATVMRRLLTGYAVAFNRRHRRHGHLFQNRYKSILCQEDPYLLELVRYIHLNPLRVRFVANLKTLDSYPYSGHSILMGRRKNDWQDTDTVLVYFGRKASTARKQYRAYVEKGID